MTEVTITIKCSNSDKADITTENSISVAELKELIAVKLTIAAEQQRLIFRGRVLKDELTLEYYEITSGSTVHLVKGFVKTASAPSSSTPVAAPTPSTPSVAPGASPFGAFPSPFGGSPGAAPDFQTMQDNLMRNPEMMQQIMNSPMMENILTNPEMLRSMMVNNPQMQAMLDSNPQIRHILNDPAIMRQTMEMMRNPAAMREAMRSQDLAMSQLENIPGGFNALRRMYEDVQEPMMEASGGFGAPAPTSTPAPAAPTLTAPNTSALPNPWGARPAAAPSANPFLGGMGGMGAMPGFGGMGGMGGLPPGVDPSQMAAMMENPMMQQMMQQMMADPALLQQMAGGNPQLAAAMQNPQIRAMMSDPAFLRQLSNPQTMQAMMQMQQSMQTLQGQGFPMPGLGGFGAPQFGGSPFGAPAQPALGGLDFSSLLGGPRPGGASFTAPVQDPPEVRFASQLQQLQDMGFPNNSANISALIACNGCVTQAIERLLGTR